jgi:hypothetical protein
MPWGDSNLYLGRNRDDLTLTVEHRAAPAMPAVALELAQRANALALEVIEPRAPQTPRHARSTSASQQRLSVRFARLPSPSCAACAASAPPASTSDWPP